MLAKPKARSSMVGLHHVSQSADLALWIRHRCCVLGHAVWRYRASAGSGLVPASLKVRQGCGRVCRYPAIGWMT